MGRPVWSARAATSNVAAPSGAARWVMPSGSSPAAARAVSLNRSGSVRKRNLSKYTFERRPDDRTKSPWIFEAEINRCARSSGTARSIGARDEPGGSDMNWYRSMARPLLFAPPPEASHRLARWLLALPLPWERLGRAERDPSLELSLASLQLANPVALAAGFDKTGRHVDALGRLGFGYIVCGTFTRHPRAGHPKPRIVRYPRRMSMTNAMGLPNPGAEAAAGTLARVRRAGPRVASIADEDVADVLEN